MTAEVKPWPGAPVTLSALLGVSCTPDPLIGGVTADSRTAMPGDLFAALAGVSADGARFIDDAVAKGAAAVLADVATARARRDLSARGVAVVGVADPRRALAFAAARFFEARPDRVVGVTGTNGKTSTAWFCAGIWRRLGHRAGVVGTLGALGDGFAAPLAHTTPDPVTLHRTLAAMAAAGIDRVAMEASSHGLAQRRVDAVRFEAAGFTNITQDHLDYHVDFEAYFLAKQHLFTNAVAAGGAAVFAMAGAGSRRMRDIAAARGLRIVETGAEAADIRLVAASSRVDGLSAAIETAGRKVQISMPCIGDFQLDNALVAAGLVASVEDGVSFADAVAALDDLAAPPGRMQRAASFNGAAVYVDYAHTPDALRVALRAARAHATGRLVVVFGAGGDRDRSKRPRMGEAATACADVVIVTDDNPRSEDPAAIRREVCAGAPGAVSIGDRMTAIVEAVSGLHPGDVLIVAGKGHEQGQIVGDKVHPFDDVDAVREAVAAHDHAGRL